MRAVFRKEIKQYFNSPLGYVFLAIFLLISGFMFMTNNLYSLNSDIKTFFGSILNFVMFLTPMLTMRLFSEEKKMRTEQLLLTSPVSLPGIVLGKYGAAMGVFLIGLLFTLLYPVCLASFGVFDLYGTLGNYIGIIVAVSAFISIGIFISVLTENQMVAGVISYTVLMGLWLIGFLGSALNMSGMLRKVMDWLSISQRYYELTYGIFNVSSLLYYLTITAIFLFLTIRVLEQRRVS